MLSTIRISVDRIRTICKMIISSSHIYKDEGEDNRHPPVTRSDLIQACYRTPHCKVMEQPTRSQLSSNRLKVNIDGLLRAEAINYGTSDLKASPTVGRRRELTIQSAEFYRRLRMALGEEEDPSGFIRSTLLIPHTISLVIVDSQEEDLIQISSFRTVFFVRETRVFVKGRVWTGRTIRGEDLGRRRNGIHWIPFKVWAEDVSYGKSEESGVRKYVSFSLVLDDSLYFV